LSSSPHRTTDIEANTRWEEREITNRKCERREWMGIAFNKKRKVLIQISKKLNTHKAVPPAKNDGRRRWGLFGIRETKSGNTMTQ